MKLNLGSGNCPLGDGWLNLDGKTGDSLYPLFKYQGDGKSSGFDSGCAEEIRASHCLEHFSHHQTAAILQEWVRVLKPGGWLKIAVPDFDWILNTRNRQAWDGKAPDGILESYLFGGQTDEDDFHKALFDTRKLERLLSDCGLINIKPWTSEIQDCASLPVSLNLMGQKPEATEVKQIERGINCKHGNPWYSNFGVEASCCMCCGIQLAHGKSPGYCVKCMYVELTEKPTDDLAPALDDNEYALDEIEKRMRIGGKPKYDVAMAGDVREKCKGLCYFDGHDTCRKCGYKIDLAQSRPTYPQKSSSRVQVFAAGRWQDLDGTVECADEDELARAKAGQLQMRTIHLAEKRTARIALCLSTPRLGFLRPLERLLGLSYHTGISLFSGDGVFWHHSLSRSIKNAVEFDFEDGSDGFDFILTADYDTYAVLDDIHTLATLLARSPEADCVVSLQMKRGGTGEVLAGSGQALNLSLPLVPIETGHFGLTLFRKDFFTRLPKPWFFERPDPNGDWGEGRVDADIGFWNNAKRAGLKVMLAPGVVVGHGEELITYPRIENGKPVKVYQAVNDWLSVRTKPEGIGVQ